MPISVAGPNLLPVVCHTRGSSRHAAVRLQHRGHQRARPSQYCPHPPSSNIHAAPSPRGDPSSFSYPFVIFFVWVNLLHGFVCSLPCIAPAPVQIHWLLVSRICFMKHPQYLLGLPEDLLMLDFRWVMELNIGWIYSFLLSVQHQDNLSDYSSIWSSK